MITRKVTAAVILGYLLSCNNCLINYINYIEENINKFMHITAFKAILARRINKRGCENYKNTFARMESGCTLRFGFKALINSISYTKHSNLFLHFLSTSKRFSRP